MATDSPVEHAHPRATACAPIELLPWVVAIVAYFGFGDYLPLGSQILIMILFALSLDLVLGYAGIVTLGHAAFFGVGAYAAGIYAVHVIGRAVVRPAGRRGRRRRRRPGLRRWSSCAPPA